MNNDDVKQRVVQLIRQDVRETAAYHVNDASGMVKLDAMENPFAWPGGLEIQWLQELQQLQLNRYPDPLALELQQQLRDVFSIDPALGILLGNGSDEIIHLLIQAVAGTDTVIMAPEPAFVMYRVLAHANRVRFCGVPLRVDFSLDESAMLDAIERENPAIIFLAQPNNPTGNLWSAAAIERIVRATSGLVVIDEAYLAFSSADYLAWASRYPNVLVMRTLSKLGLAGLRLGFLVGHSTWVSEINKLRLPYNINTLTQVSAGFALRNIDAIQQQVAALKVERSGLVSALQELAGVTAYPSEANFILLQLAKEYSAARVYQAMKSHGVLVKCLDGSHVLLANCLRITVGTQQENAMCLDALRKSLS